MRIFVFGNPDLPADSLPLRILPRLRERFPQISFETKDPHEEWDCPPEITILDTVCGINKIGVFPDLERFSESPKLTVHDFDVLDHLQLLQKLGKLEKVRIIGIPPDLSEKEAVKGVAAILESNPL